MFLFLEKKEDNKINPLLHPNKLLEHFDYACEHLCANVLVLDDMKKICTIIANLTKKIVDSTTSYNAIWHSSTCKIINNIMSEKI